jgi:hypothetical protein
MYLETCGGSPSQLKFRNKHSQLRGTPRGERSMCEQPLTDDEMKLLTETNAMDIQLYAFAEAAWEKRAAFIAHEVGWQLLCDAGVVV